MILNSKQRKELPDSDYGLPEERKFPLVDKEHVLKAIQFFKYCPPDKKKKLAANINRKAKEFGMKINAKGEFAKYISPENTKAADESCYEYEVKEASNIGTLSPIVGGIPTEAEEKELDDTDKIVLGFSEECCGLFPGSQYRRDDGRGYSDLASNNRPQEIVGRPHHNDMSDFVRTRLFNSMHNFELQCMYDYVTNDFKEREAVFNARKDVIKVIDDTSTSDEVKISKLVTIIASHKKMSEFNFLLQTVYLMDKELCTDVIAKLRNTDCKILTNFHAPYVDIFDYIDGDYALKSEYSKKCPNTIVNDLYYFGNEMYGAKPFDVDWKILEYLKKEEKLDDFYHAVSDLYAVQTLNAVRHMVILNAIDWYAFIYYSRNNYATYIGIEGNVFRLVQFERAKTGNRPMYMAYLIGTMNGREIEFVHDMLIVKDNKCIIKNPPRVITMDPWSPKVNNCKGKKCLTTEGMSFFNQDDGNNTIRGIHMDKDLNEPCLGFKADKDFIGDLYDKCHYTIAKNFNEKNFDDMKDNLSVSFYAITTIGNELDKDEIKLELPDIQELKRLRSLLISDFKVYLNKLEKAEPEFDFLGYFFENRLADSDVQEVKTLFTNTFQTLRYW